MFDGMSQLQPTTTGPGMILTAHVESDVGLNLLSGFFELTFVGKNQPRHNQGLGAGPAFDQPAVHQQLIEADLGDNA